MAEKTDADAIAEMLLRTAGKPKILRGILIQIEGDCSKFKDVAFLEMPHVLVEHDADGAFLKVVTEVGHYKIRLEKY